MKSRTVVVLDNIRSAHNVGSIFRTADGAGVEKIDLFGYTPSPIDRFGRIQSEIAKTALGASETVAWEHIENMDAPKKLSLLKEEGFQIISVEQTERSVELGACTRPDKVVYILGNEVDGIGQELLDISDQVVEIPMRGVKESLNVSVAAGIVLFC